MYYICIKQEGNMKTYAFIKEKKLVIIYASSKDSAIKLMNRKFGQCFHDVKLEEIEEILRTDGLTILITK